MSVISVIFFQTFICGFGFLYYQVQFTVFVYQSVLGFGVLVLYYCTHFIQVKLMVTFYYTNQQLSKRLIAVKLAVAVIIPFKVVIVLFKV